MLLNLYVIPSLFPLPFAAAASVALAVTFTVLVVLVNVGVNAPGANLSILLTVILPAVFMFVPSV